MTEILFDAGTVVDEHYEFVERKGLGHPDTLCDAIAEMTSYLYSEFCRKRFDGGVAHHWFDKVMLVGGSATMGFGHGDLTQPYSLILAGKAATSVGKISIPIEQIFQDACRRVLTETLFEFNFAKWARCSCLIQSGRGPQNNVGRYSPRDATDLYFARDFESQVSNDGNLLTGYAPLSALESLVLWTEQHLQSAAMRESHPFLGRDIKIFGTRYGADLTLDIRLPFLAAKTPSLTYYKDAVAHLETELRATIAVSTDDTAVSVRINRTDPPDIAYLTVSGSVADTGDVGVVGRGNRSNGLITPMRPQSIEASAGKNPIDHTGKLYALFARRLAASLAKGSGMRIEVFVRALKHEPLSSPGAVLIRTSRPLSHATRVELKRIADAEILRLPSMFDEILAAGVTFW
jgi:S-adenosylmethionine synthetase